MMIAKNVVIRSKRLPGDRAILRPINSPNIEYAMVPVVNNRMVLGSLSSIITLICFVPLALVMNIDLPNFNVKASQR